MISIIVHATGAPDPLGETISRAFGAASRDLEVIVVVGNAAVCLGCAASWR